MDRGHSRGALAAFIVPLVLALASPARAESGQFNLHVDLGPGFAFFEDPAVTEVPVGFVGMASFDWQFLPPVALEVIVGGGALLDSAGNVAGTFHSGLGARVRIIDNQEGYLLGEDGGDWMGNFWASAHLGFHYFDGPQFGVDAAVGYEFSVVRPVQLGVFARGVLLVAGDDDLLEGIVTVGVNASFDLGGRVDPLDRDRDGLPDEREINQHETDPGDADTDDDALNDGVEVNHTTNPLDSDTDDDAALDGREDADHDGIPDPDEADPRIPDTDAGGVPDGWELEHGLNPRDPADDDADRDRVLQHVDACPDTAEGAEVDERGCVIIRERLVLPGIQFEYDSAEILPSSENNLQIGLSALRDNPDVRVEIGGHTDNQGSRAYNRELSQRRAQAVFDWMVSHGIDGGRMTVRGYGSARPIAPNDTPEGQAQNRRIEFTVRD